MKRGAILIIVGFLLLLITGIVWVVFRMGLIGGGAEAEPIELPAAPLEILQEDSPTPVPELTFIVVAVQDIGRGMEITEDAVALWSWPADAMPVNAVEGSPEIDLDQDGIADAIEEVLGKRMRTNAVRFEPILSGMLGDRIELEGTGSDAALAFPTGRVLVALPLPSITNDPTSAIAYALRAGDRIDVMISLALIDLDEEFHTKLPNQVIQLDVGGGGQEGETEDQQLTLTEFTYGRIEEGPLGLIFNVIPSEENQRPRLATQLTVQNAMVVRVGRYPTYEEEIRGIDPQAPPTPTPVPEDVEQEGQVSAPPPPPEPEVIVLAVSPQEALVLKFAGEINADLDFALRSVGDQAIYQTDSVTLQYLMEAYNMGVPPKLQYGMAEPVKVEELLGAGEDGN